MKWEIGNRKWDGLSNIYRVFSQMFTILYMFINIFNIFVNITIDFE